VRLVGAVGIEIASLLHKDLHGNDLVPLPRFQLLLNVVKRKNCARHTNRKEQISNLKVSRSGT